MVLVTGPFCSGKKAFVREWKGWTETQLSEHAVWNVQKLAQETDDLEALCRKLSQYDVVIITETGAGVVPIGANERHAREQAGRLGCLLAGQASCVVRVYCGIPTVIKGVLE